MIHSNWKLTFDPTGVPLVLLDYGQWLAEEIRFPLAMGLEIVPIVGAAAPYLRETGNALVTISYERFLTPTSGGASDSTARRDILDTLNSFQSLGKKPLRLEIYGLTDRYWQFASAKITSIEPGRHVRSAQPRLSQKIHITAATITRTGP